MKKGRVIHIKGRNSKLFGDILCGRLFNWVCAAEGISEYGRNVLVPLSDHKDAVDVTGKSPEDFINEHKLFNIFITAPRVSGGETLMSIIGMLGVHNIQLGGEKEKPGRYALPFGRYDSDLSGRITVSDNVFRNCLDVLDRPYSGYVTDFPAGKTILDIIRRYESKVITIWNDPEAIIEFHKNKGDPELDLAVLRTMLVQAKITAENAAGQGNHLEIQHNDLIEDTAAVIKKVAKFVRSTVKTGVAVKAAERWAVPRRKAPDTSEHAELIIAAAD